MVFFIVFNLVCNIIAFKIHWALGILSLGLWIRHVDLTSVGEAIFQYLSIEKACITDRQIKLEVNQFRSF